MVPGVRTAVVTEQELSLPEAVSCRLFAACLLRTPQGHVLLAPDACAEGRPRRVIDRLLAEGFLAAAGFLALDAGPAALRLRIPLPAADLGLVHPGVLVEPRRLDTLAEWARTCCREQVDDGARADPRLLAESRRALDLLTRLLGLPAGFYPFQRAAVPAASHP
jgi:succinylarginine dihydrolase